MKMKTIEAVNRIQVLGSMMGTELPRKTSIAVAKNYRKLNDELKEYNEQRDELIKKYGKEDNGQYKIEVSEQESFMNFIKELEPLNQMEVEVDITKITYDDLPESISPEKIMGLEFMIEVE